MKIKVDIWHLLNSRTGAQTGSGLKGKKCFLGQRRVQFKWLTQERWLWKQQFFTLNSQGRKIFCKSRPGTVSTTVRWLSEGKGRRGVGKENSTAGTCHHSWARGTLFLLSEKCSLKTKVKGQNHVSLILLHSLKVTWWTSSTFQRGKIFKNIVDEDSQ